MGRCIFTAAWGSFGSTPYRWYVETRWFLSASAVGSLTDSQLLKFLYHFCCAERLFPDNSWSDCAARSAIAPKVEEKSDDCERGEVVGKYMYPSGSTLTTEGPIVWSLQRRESYDLFDMAPEAAALGLTDRLVGQQI